ncbi:MAG: hypothetical protein JST82_11205 [Bacteroidetes bacterium]|nr:hypothetical protein [Bacteroidota bacterium]
MSAKIIQLSPETSTPSELQTYINAAWSFAYALLWHEQAFNKDEINRAKQHINCYFEFATDKKTAFIAFCERVVLANRFIQAEQSRYVPLPSIWLNRHYEHGFAGTKSWLQRIQIKRQEIPNYLQHISVVAEQYRQYVLNSSVKSFTACRKKLTELKAYGLLQYFYNAIIHLHYINN